VKQILESNKFGADPNAKNKDNQTALYLTAKTDIPIVQRKSSKRKQK
jgi:hypothetical protein